MIMIIIIITITTIIIIIIIIIWQPWQHQKILEAKRYRAVSE